MPQDGAANWRRCRRRLSLEACLRVKGSRGGLPAGDDRLWFPRCADDCRDQLDPGAGRIGGIQQLEGIDELTAAVAISTSAWTFPLSRSIPANRLSVPWRLYS